MSQSIHPNQYPYFKFLVYQLRDELNALSARAIGKRRSFDLLAIALGYEGHSDLKYSQAGSNVHASSPLLQPTHGQLSQMSERLAKALSDRSLSEIGTALERVFAGSALSRSRALPDQIAIGCDTAGALWLLPIAFEGRDEKLIRSVPTTPEEMAALGEPLNENSSFIIANHYVATTSIIAGSDKACDVPWNSPLKGRGFLDKYGFKYDADLNLNAQGQYEDGLPTEHESLLLFEHEGYRLSYRPRHVFDHLLPEFKVLISNSPWVIGEAGTYEDSGYIELRLQGDIGIDGFNLIRLSISLDAEESDIFDLNIILDGENLEPGLKFASTIIEMMEARGLPVRWGSVRAPGNVLIEPDLVR